MSRRSGTIFCVDDNLEVCAAIRAALKRRGLHQWVGENCRADNLVELVSPLQPNIVVLDIDMPGRSPLEVLVELVEAYPDCRVVIFTGHIRRELIERAIDAGAWAYVSKNDGEDHLFEAIDKVLADEMSLSPEAAAAFRHSPPGGGG